MPADNRKRAERLQVAVVAETAAIHQLGGALQQAGYRVHTLPLSLAHAPERIRETGFPVVLLRATPRGLSSAADLCRAVAASGAALVLVTPTVSAALLALAREAGAMLHLVEPITSHALTAAVTLAVARSQDLRELQARWTALRQSARTRQVIERAKAVLMRRLGLTEEQAHRRLQLESRSRNRKLIDTAWHVIRAEAELARHWPAPSPGT